MLVGMSADVEVAGLVKVTWNGLSIIPIFFSGLTY